MDREVLQCNMPMHRKHKIYSMHNISDDLIWKLTKRTEISP